MPRAFPRGGSIMATANPRSTLFPGMDILFTERCPGANCGRRTAFSSFTCPQCGAAATCCPFCSYSVHQHEVIALLPAPTTVTQVQQRPTRQKAKSWMNWLPANHVSEVLTVSAFVGFMATMAALLWHQDTKDRSARRRWTAAY